MDNQFASSLEREPTTASFEHQAHAPTQFAYKAPVSTIAMLDSLHASGITEAWGILVDTGAATSVAPQSFASDIELSPPPSTLQLITATGKAVKTYGLRKVHLQSRGLSLEVSFVIADVFTPLLGLDTMIKNSLSLHAEQDMPHFLVKPAGDTTQLEHIRRHLYMIACPSQHGLSHCFIGSLSHVIGFLPADKELHEQSLASSSSSSTDLDEYTSKHQRAQDSLAFQCQYVVPLALLEHEDLSFELSSGKEEVADTGGELRAQSFYPKLSRPTKQSSAQERELHNLDHTALPWCVRSQEAKGIAFKQKKRAISARTSKIQLAYVYIMQPQDKEPTAILTWVGQVLLAA